MTKRTVTVDVDVRMTVEVELEDDGDTTWCEAFAKARARFMRDVNSPTYPHTCDITEVHDVTCRHVWREVDGKMIERRWKDTGEASRTAGFNGEYRSEPVTLPAPPPVTRAECHGDLECWGGGAYRVYWWEYSV